MSSDLRESHGRIEPTAALAGGAWRRGQWLITLILCWPLLAAAMDASEYLEDADRYFDKGEYPVAVIQLKNALLADPQSTEARLLLGRAYLRLGQGFSAIKELERARDLGADREAVLQPLGRAYLLAGRADTLLQTLMPEVGDPLPLRVDPGVAGTGLSGQKERRDGRRGV